MTISVTLANPPRANRHSLHPYHCSDEMNEALEVNGSSFVSGRKAAAVFHSTEATFDAVAVSVDEFVVCNDELARSVRRDDGLGSHGGNDRPQSIAVIGFVGQNCLAGLSFQKSRRLRDVVNLPCGYDEPQRPT